MEKVSGATVLSPAGFGTASWPTGWSFSSKTFVPIPDDHDCLWLIKLDVPQRPVTQSGVCVLLEFEEQSKDVRAPLLSCVKIQL